MILSRLLLSACAFFWMIPCAAFAVCVVSISFDVSLLNVIAGSGYDYEALVWCAAAGGAIAGIASAIRTREWHWLHWISLVVGIVFVAWLCWQWHEYVELAEAKLDQGTLDGLEDMTVIIGMLLRTALAANIPLAGLFGLLYCWRRRCLVRRGVLMPGDRRI